jgi:hypothetical protein
VQRKSSVFSPDSSFPPVSALPFFHEIIGNLTKIAMCNIVFSVSVSIFENINLFENKINNRILVSVLCLLHM